VPPRLARTLVGNNSIIRRSDVIGRTVANAMDIGGRTVASAETILGRAGGMSRGHAEGADTQGEREEGLGGEPNVPYFRSGFAEQVGQCRSASDLGPGRHLGSWAANMSWEQLSQTASADASRTTFWRRSWFRVSQASACSLTTWASSLSRAAIRPAKACAVRTLRAVGSLLRRACAWRATRTESFWEAIACLEAKVCTSH
jgi:hypothetical protein